MIKNNIGVLNCNNTRNIYKIKYISKKLEVKISDKEIEHSSKGIKVKCLEFEIWIKDFINEFKLINSFTHVS